MSLSPQGSPFGGIDFRGVGMTTPLFDNPLGTDGFEFVEFTGPEPAVLSAAVRAHGLHRRVAPPLQERAALQAGRHQLHPQHGAGAASRPSSAARTGPRSTPWPSGCATRPRRCELALQRGAKAGARHHRPDGAQHPGDRGHRRIADLYLVDRYGAQAIYDVDFRPIPGAVETRTRRTARGCAYIDHLTHNVHRGNMQTWADFYERIFNFRADPLLRHRGQGHRPVLQGA